jgi:acyl carrier protein
LNDLELEISELIITCLALEDIEPSDIDLDAPLFIEGLGLDSIDALEIGVALQKKYAVIFSENSEDNKVHFASLRALAEHISSSVATR